METQQHSLPRAPRHHRRWHYVLAMTLSALILGLGFYTTSLVAGPFRSAQAMENSHGPGVNWGNGVHVHGAGAFIVNGKYAYCAEPWVRSGAAIPNYVGVQALPANSSDGVSVAATVGTPLREISFLLARYGQTNDNVQAAAVALAIWEIRGADGRGNAEYEAELVRVRESVGTAVVALTQQLRAEATAWIAAIQATESSEDTPGITLDQSSPYRGTVQVPPGTISLHIHNGTFMDGSNVRNWPQSGAPLGTSLSWIGEPPAESWGKFYQVRFTGEYLEIPVSVLWGDGQGSQSSVSLVEPTRRPLRATSLDADTSWQPEVSSTVASKFVSVGENHSDDVVFSSAPSATALTGEWRWRISPSGAREWMPVTARVTAYGPYLSDPALNPAFTAPTGAPIAASATFTTDPARDQRVPQRYHFEFDQPILEQGYYTYKWDIDGSDQIFDDDELSGCATFNDDSLCSALPKNYFFSDGFGTVGETQIGRSTAAFTTELSTTRISLTDSFTDRIAIAPLPNWLRNDSGTRISLTLTGTAYLMPGPELAQSVEVPGNAIELATVRVTTDPEINAQNLDSSAITIPIDTERKYTFVTVRWCVRDEDQAEDARGFWEEHCDDFGIPAESAAIVHPEVRTEASSMANPGTPIADTAIVAGEIPEDTELIFELFALPQPGTWKQSTEGNHPTEQWTDEERATLALHPQCGPENLVFRSAPVPVQSGPAADERYRSAEVRLDMRGTYWWVESLVHRNPETGVETLLHRGDCGVPNETTVVDLQAPVAVPQLAKTGSSALVVPAVWVAGLLAAGGLVMWSSVRTSLARKRRTARRNAESGGEGLSRSKKRFFPAHHLAKM